jgi:hypothetical protein
MKKNDKNQKCAYCEKEITGKIYKSVRLEKPLCFDCFREEYFWLKNWRELIQEEMEKQNETFDDVVHSTLSEDELSKLFSIGYGWINGTPFTLWTKNRVYFPAEYDGSEFVGSAPRNPCNEKTKHIGQDT